MAQPRLSRPSRGVQGHTFYSIWVPKHDLPSQCGQKRHRPRSFRVAGIATEHEESSVFHFSTAMELSPSWLRNGLNGADCWLSPAVYMFLAAIEAANSRLLAVRNRFNSGWSPQRSEPLNRWESQPKPGDLLGEPAKPRPGTEGRYAGRRTDQGCRCGIPDVL